MSSSPTGFLLVDKPSGPTSHDVVGRVRRALRTREVGHAGTLDPMASGLLVVLVGSATRLAPYVTAGDKQYVARVSLGVATDSLDAQGKVVSEAPLPDELKEELASLAVHPDRPSPAIAAALLRERSRTEQIPPAVSAIHVDGERAYARSARGETVTLPPRPVLVHKLEVRGASVAPPTIECLLSVSKGYYVRSFARDFAANLGTIAHLSSLRRITSGAFTIAQACALDAITPEALLPFATALPSIMPCAQLNEEGVRRARFGQALSDECFQSLPPVGTAAWFHGDILVAIGNREAECARVVRGFPA